MSPNKEIAFLTATAADFSVIPPILAPLIVN
jgi:hypothetical protein